MKYLTVAQVLAIHDQMVKRFGGSHGIRDIGLVESAVARPKGGFGKEEFYKDIYSKAAALLQSLLKNHSFVDGNKRTALASAGIFLKINGYDFRNSGKEEVGFGVKVDNENLTLQQIASFLKSHTKRRK